MTLQQTTQKPKCGTCNKTTEYMYSMNSGVFCEKHWQVAYHIEKTRARLAQLQERINSFQWNRY